VAIAETGKKPFLACLPLLHLLALAVAAALLVVIVVVAAIAVVIVVVAASAAVIVAAAVPVGVGNYPQRLYLPG
jgi:hypothetical protein